jgi:hypothetical protein
MTLRETILDILRTPMARSGFELSEIEEIVIRTTEFKTGIFGEVMRMKREGLLRQGGGSFFAAVKVAEVKAEKQRSLFQ